jgi:hypothetical protein
MGNVISYAKNNDSVGSWNITLDDGKPASGEFVKVTLPEGLDPGMLAFSPSYHPKTGAPASFFTKYDNKILQKNR